MKIHVEADLVLVTADLIAERGQYLMIINGVCVGVYTGKPPSESAGRFGLESEHAFTNIRPPTRSPMARPPLALAKPKKEAKTRPGAKSPGLDKITAYTVYQAILSFDPASPPTARALTDAMELPRSDPHYMQKVSRVLMFLIETGFLFATRSGHRNAKTYCLTDTAPKTAEPLKDETRVSPTSGFPMNRGAPTPLEEAAE